MGAGKRQIGWRMAVGVVVAAVACGAAGCGGSGGHDASVATAEPAAQASDPASGAAGQHYDMQTVEGCFNGGGENTHEAPDFGWFDLVHLGTQATSEGLGAFSTFSGSSFDDAAYYFFVSHDQALAMAKTADRQAHGAKVHVQGNVIVALYEDLHPSQLELEHSCLPQ